MDFSKSILFEKPYLGSDVCACVIERACVYMFVEAVTVAEVAEVREVENNILEARRKL